MLLRRPKMVDQETQTMNAQQKAMDSRSFASKSSTIQPIKSDLDIRQFNSSLTNLNRHVPFSDVDNCGKKSDVKSQRPNGQTRKLEVEEESQIADEKRTGIRSIGKSIQGVPAGRPQQSVTSGPRTGNPLPGRIITDSVPKLAEHENAISNHFFT
jgi:hypothetical protein